MCPPQAFYLWDSSRGLHLKSPVQSHPGLPDLLGACAWYLGQTLKGEGDKRSADFEALFLVLVMGWAKGTSSSFPPDNKTT